MTEPVGGGFAVEDDQVPLEGFAVGLAEKLGQFIRQAGHIRSEDGIGRSHAKGVHPLSTHGRPLCNPCRVTSRKIISWAQSGLAPCREMSSHEDLKLLFKGHVVQL